MDEDGATGTVGKHLFEPAEAMFTGEWMQTSLHFILVVFQVPKPALGLTSVTQNLAKHAMSFIRCPQINHLINRRDSSSARMMGAQCSSLYLGHQQGFASTSLIRLLMIKHVAQKKLKSFATFSRDLGHPRSKFSASC